MRTALSLPTEAVYDDDDASRNRLHLPLCRDEHKSIGYLYVYWYKLF